MLLLNNSSSTGNWTVWESLGTLPYLIGLFKYYHRTGGLKDIARYESIGIEGKAGYRRVRIEGRVIYGRDCYKVELDIEVKGIWSSVKFRRVGMDEWMDSEGF